MGAENDDSRAGRAGVDRGRDRRLRAGGLDDDVALAVERGSRAQCLCRRPLMS
jgi:hypothetical protein